MRRRSAGFTLIEMMVVVAIIGVLAAVAIPTFTKVTAKSRRAEAFAALRAIWTSQTSYWAEKDAYAPDFDQLGVGLTGGARIDAATIAGPHYTFTLVGKTLDGIPNGNYRATATGDIDPTDPVLDIIIIENRLTVLGP